jgi:hypothetical protein
MPRSLLGGMGPLAAPQTYAGKLFAGCYALYCGLVVIAVAGIVLVPVAHPGSCTGSISKKVSATSERTARRRARPDARPRAPSRGGFYREIWRAPHGVEPDDRRGGALGDRRRSTSC